VKMGILMILDKWGWSVHELRLWNKGKFLKFEGFINLVE